MTKKQIIILIAVFLTVIIASTIIFSFALNNNHTTEKTKESNELTVGQYTLKYGIYKGIEREYNPDTEKTEEKEITLNLTKNKINDIFYDVRGTSLYVNGYAMYEIIANNKLRLLAGEGIDFEYEGK